MLKDRAAQLAAARSFFLQRGVIEVDCPILSASASVDLHIDLIPASYSNRETRYLHSSPEFGMKRLLALGSGDIYQLSHVFRDSEWGQQHNPEFMMAEWYRIGFSFVELIQETFEFAQIFLGEMATTSITYREAFQKYAGIDYLDASEEEFIAVLRGRGIEVSQSQNTREGLLNLILGLFVEPSLGKDGLCALTHYPANQAALARTCWHGSEAVAERFELFYQGVELANGYHELTDPKEQRHRFEEANQKRAEQGKERLPIDENFLQSLEQGLPDCCGVAVGFDRLMMVRHQTHQIADVIPFGWDKA